MKTAELAYLTYSQLRSAFQRAREATHDIIQEVLYAPAGRQEKDPVRGHYSSVIRYLNLAYYRFTQHQGATELARLVAREFEINTRPFSDWTLREHVELYERIVGRVASVYTPPVAPEGKRPARSEEPAPEWKRHDAALKDYVAGLDRVGRLARGLSRRRGKTLITVLVRYCDYQDWLDESNALREDPGADYVDSDPALATMPEAPSPLEVFGNLSYEPLIREVVLGGPDPKEHDWLRIRLTFGLSLSQEPPAAPEG